MSGYLPQQSVSYFRLPVIYSLVTRLASLIFFPFHCKKKPQKKENVAGVHAVKFLLSQEPTKPTCQQTIK